METKVSVTGNTNSPITKVVNTRLSLLKLLQMESYYHEWASEMQGKSQQPWKEAGWAEDLNNRNLSGVGIFTCSKLSTTVHSFLLEGRRGKPPLIHHIVLFSTILQFYGLLKKRKEILRGQFEVPQHHNAVRHEVTL